MNRFFLRLVLSQIALAVGACATTQSPRLASSMPVAAPAVQPPKSEAHDDADEVSNISASVFLERALDALRDGQGAFAVAALHAALASGELNDAGRALAYWYIYVAHTAAGQLQQSHDALSDFVSVAQSVLMQRDATRYADANGSDFVDRFDLKGRLARGRAILSLAWAEHHSHFGRSQEAPVPVQSEEELAYFVELTPACAHPLDKKTSQMTSMSSDPKALRRVEFQCSGVPSDTTFFFEWHGKKTEVPTIASHAPVRSRRKGRDASRRE